MRDTAGAAREYGLSIQRSSVETAEGGFFHALAENVPDIVFTTTPDGQVEYFNSRWHQYTGQRVDEALGGGYAAHIHPDDRTRLLRDWDAIRASGRDGSSEARYRRFDGLYRWHRVNVAPYRDARGEIVRWLGTFSDIHAARAAERSFRTLADTMPIMVWAARPNGETDYYNMRWEERVGDIGTLIGLGWRDIIHPADLDATTRSWQRSVATGEAFSVQLRLRMRDGDYRWHEATATPDRDEDGVIVHWYGACVDTNEAAVLRGLLHDRDVVTRLLHELAQRTPTLLFTAAPDGGIDFINDRWSEVLGVKAHQLLGNGWMQYVHADDLPRILATLREHWRIGKPYVGEWRLKRSNQTYRWVEIRIEAQRDETGRIVRWFGAGTDIDMQRRAIDALDLLAESVTQAAVAEDVDIMLARVAEAALAGVADMSVFDLIDTAAPLRRIVVAAPGVPAHEFAVVKQFDTRVNGLSQPVAQAIAERRSVHIPTIDEAFLQAHVAPELRRTAWRDSGVRSMIVAPLIVGDSVLGSLTLLRSRPGVDFDSQDVRIVEEIARRSAIAVENIRLGERARAAVAEREERFRAIADAIPQLMWVCDERGKVEWVNARWLAFTGQSSEEALDQGWRHIIHPDDADAASAAFLAAAAGGQPYESQFRMRRSDGAYRWFLGRATPVGTASGVTWYGTNTDIDDARRAARAMRVFAGVGEALSETLGLQETLDAIMRIVVPEFADWAVITLMDEARDLRVAAIFHDDPEVNARLATVVGKRYARGDIEIGSPAAVRSREPRLSAQATYEDGARVVEPDVLQILWDAVGFRSVLAIPLVVASNVRGTLTMCMADSGRAFDAGDVPFFMDIGRRIAPAIGNAELYERERRVAQSFQEAALPALLPQADGYVFSAIYEAGRAEALVGGDWYDAFKLLDGRIVVSIGDVAGSGLRAAVTMANIRQAIRGVAHVHADPELMLEAADRALRTDIPDSFATAFVGVIDPIAETISYKSAGHPAALLELPDGRIEELRIGGLPLGIRDADRLPPSVLSLTVGSSLHFYTDGLTESTHDMLAGEQRLRAAVASTRGSDPAQRAAAIYRTVLVDGSHDDVAILTVTLVPRCDRMCWVFDARDRAAAMRVRDAVLTRLGLAQRAPALHHAAELILAEVVGNLARYAPCEVEAVLESDAGRSVLHVRDNGPGFEFLPKLPPDLYSENGRGLFLISALAADFKVTRRPG